MRAIFTVIGVIIVLMMFGTMMGGIKDAQTDTRTDTFAAVTTGAGVTTADVVLVASLYDADIVEVTGITSDNALDGPLPDVYVSGTRTLTVRGLAAADTRSLSVTYRYGALTGDSAAAGTFLGFTPLFIGIAIVVTIIGAMIVAFAKR